jgi:parvulin-like peptidyl-prolyl isomerase
LAEQQRLARLRRLAQKGRRVEEPPKVRKGQVLARVGSDAIVESDLDVEGRRAKALGDIRAKTGGDVPADVREEVERQIKEALREPLKQRIETKLIYQNAAKNIPAANLAGMKKAIGKEFDKEQVPRLLKVFHVESRFELEAKLQEVNSSLEIQKSDFIEIVLAREWYHQQVKVDEEFVRDELLNYYRDHETEFVRPGQVRWEQLSVLVTKYPSREAARAVLAQMGNDVIRGVPFAEVAKARSDGPTAASGGVWPWTVQGSLVSQQIERAIFGLPVASLSRILEDETEMHIVRVVQRQEGTRIPFEEAQAQIRKKLMKERDKQARDAFVNQIRKGIHVWTIYDNEAEAKRPPSDLPVR